MLSNGLNRDNSLHPVLKENTIPYYAFSWKYRIANYIFEIAPKNGIFVNEFESMLRLLVYE